MPVLNDITGQKFGKWTVLSFAGSVKMPCGRPATKWRCQCDCGTIKDVFSSGLPSGKSTSCGCSKHGMRHTTEYRCWAGMKTRTTNPHEANWGNYGGRGIKMCDRWLNSFEAFYADMGPCPSPNHSVERKNNSLDYSPDNCEWGTRKEQARNRRSNHNITVNGVTLCLSAWAEKLGLCPSSLHGRIRRGWPEHLAVTLPAGSKLKDHF